MKYSLIIDQQTLSIIAQALGQQPWALVNPILVDIQAQVTAQTPPPIQVSPDAAAETSPVVN